MQINSISRSKYLTSPILGIGIQDVRQANVQKTLLPSKVHLWPQQEWNLEACESKEPLVHYS